MSNNDVSYIVDSKIVPICSEMFFISSLAKISVMRPIILCFQNGNLRLVT